MHKLIIPALFLASLTGCIGYHQKQCAMFISVEAEHAKELETLVIPSVETALRTMGYEQHLNNQWVKLPNSDLIKLQKESENPFVVDVFFWAEPGSYTSCNTKSATIKSEFERQLRMNHVPAAVREAIPND